MLQCIYIYIITKVISGFIKQKLYNQDHIVIKKTNMLLFPFIIHSES